MPSCLPHDQLTALLGGLLSDQQTAVLVQHVETCQNCQSVLARQSSVDDVAIPRSRDMPADWGRFADRLAQQLCEAVTPQIGNAASEPRDQERPTSLPQIPGYRFRGVLGKGGMGIVYDAIQLRFARPVAVKVLGRAEASQPNLRARFEREMAASGQLDHPNIVQAFHAGVDNGWCYLVMERIDGFTLSQIAKQSAPLRIADACQAIQLAAIGLQHAHDCGLVHRDVKPSNIMLCREGTIKLLDLGLSRWSRAAPNSRNELTETGQIMGTIDYMAPEQAAGNQEVGRSADIYGLGATLYCLLTGRVPFHGPQYASIPDKLIAVSKETPPPLRTLRLDAPDALGKVLDKLMAKQPAKRYATCREVANALAPFAAGANLVVLANQTRALATQSTTGSDDTVRSHPLPSRLAQSMTARSALITASSETTLNNRHARIPTTAWWAISGVLGVLLIISATAWRWLGNSTTDRVATAPPNHDSTAISDRLTSPLGQWSSPRPVPGLATSFVTTPSLSSDECVLVFQRYAALYIVDRKNREQPFSTPQPMGLAPSGQRCESPALSGDGLTLVFSKWEGEREADNAELWIAKRKSLDQSFTTAERIESLRMPQRQIGAWLNEDATLLVFASAVEAEPLPILMAAQRGTTDADFEAPFPLAASAPQVREVEPMLTADRRVLLTTIFTANNRPKRVLAMRSRPHPLASFGDPVPVAIPGAESLSSTSAHLSQDGKRLYFSISPPDGMPPWQLCVSTWKPRRSDAASQ